MKINGKSRESRQWKSFPPVEKNYSTFSLSIVRETAWKLVKMDVSTIQKYFENILLTGTVCHVVLNHNSDMPNAYSPDKEPLSLSIPRTLMGRLKKAAKKADMTLTDYIISKLTLGVEHISLTPDDYRAIAHATEIAQKQHRRITTKFDGATNSKIKNTKRG